MKFISKKRSNHKKPSTKPKDQQIKELHAQVNQALASQDLDKAESLALKLSELTNLPETFLKYAHLLYLQRKYDQAGGIYLGLLQKVKNDLKSEVLFGLGQVSYEKQDFSSSHYFYTLLIDSFPRFDCIGIVYLKLAKIMLMLNEPDFTYSYCEKIVELDQERVNNKSEAFAIMAHIQLSKEKNHEALELFKKALATCTSAQTLKLTILGLIYANPRFAQGICKKAMIKEIELNDWYKFYFLFALCYLKTGEYEKARRCLEEIEKFDPNNYFIQEFYGISLFYTGRKKESLLCFQGVKTKFPFDIVNSSNIEKVSRDLQGVEEIESDLEFNLNSGKLLLGKDCGVLLEPKITILGFPCSE